MSATSVRSRLVTTQSLLDRDGKLLASQSGVVGHVLPELVGVGAPIPHPAMTFTVRDDIALRFDPQISNSDHTGEMRVTGHDSGDVALAIGSAIVSGKGDTIILQDPATGRWLDDRDTAFGVSSLAIRGGRLAIAEQLTDSSVKIAEIIGGKLTFVSSYDLPDATTPAQVAWSASGTRLAIAYRAGDVVRIAVHHLDATPVLLPRQSLTFFEYQSEVPLVVTRVGWVDDDHMVIVTDHGFVARYTVAAVP